MKEKLNRIIYYMKEKEISKLPATGNITMG